MMFRVQRLAGLESDAVGRDGGDEAGLDAGGAVAQAFVEVAVQAHAHVLLEWVVGGVEVGSRGSCSGNCASVIFLIMLRAAWGTQMQKDRNRVGCVFRSSRANRRLADNLAVFLHQAFTVPFEVAALSLVVTFWSDNIPVWAVFWQSLFPTGVPAQSCLFGAEQALTPTYRLINVHTVNSYGETEVWLSSGKVILVFTVFSFTFAYGFRY